MQLRPGDELFAAPDIERTDRDDGSVLLSSRDPLGAYPPSVGHWLCRWATDAPDRVFLAERPGGDPSRPWDTLAYGVAYDRARALGQALLDAGLGPHRPLVVLSAPSLAHGSLMMASYLVGVPIVSVSVAYSLVATELATVHHIVGQCDPGMVFAECSAPFARVLEELDGRHIVTGDGGIGQSLADLAATAPTAAVDEAFAAIGPDHVAKILYTSGSTGSPKGVLTTHRMLCSNQQAIAQIWPFLSRQPPVLCDWLPWSHTFGSSHDFNMVLMHGGSLYIDAGKPAPGLIETTVANLADVSPTMSFNVPAGYSRIVERLESDEDFAARFFARLELIFYAAAALPQDVWARLDSIAQQTIGRPVPMTSSWGATETAPAATSAHFPLRQAGVIGVPIPGVTAKLVRCGEKTEIRIAGDGVTPGYLKHPRQTAAAFDDEGFYLTGDAVRFADPDDPNAGLVFDGRLTEDFKLTTGSWVSVGTLRPVVLSAVAPLLTDCVVTGHDRDWLGLLAWPAPPHAPTDPDFVAALRQRLVEHNDAHIGSSRCIRRVALLVEPPSIDRGETTDKGYINQRAVLVHRADVVELLYQDDPHPNIVIVA